MTFFSNFQDIYLGLLHGCCTNSGVSRARQTYIFTPITGLQALVIEVLQEGGRDVELSERLPPPNLAAHQ
jgi:hypothetical protein